jgi:hypothetical protein
MKPKQGKPVRQLPTRGGLFDLGKSQRSIMDYSKATPVTAASPNVIQNLRKK